MRNELLAVALVATLVLAGCSGAVDPTPSPTGTDGTSPDGETPTAAPGSGTGSGTGTGTVNFYVSDEKNAIGDFEHLNVTIEKVSFHRAGPTDGSETDAESEAETETETPESTDSPTPEGATAEPGDGEPTETATPTDEPAGTDTPSPTVTATQTVTPTDEAEAADDAGEDGEEDGDATGWIVRDVEETTVDLTELQGENATFVSKMDLPDGEYTQVRLHITEVNGTLKDGEQVNVKLPSERLKLNSKFTLGDGEEVDFVYDATVFEAGNSGKYVLKPVASQSGTNVPIRTVDDDREGDLGARFVGKVERGESATVKVTRRGDPVSGASVTVDGQTYETGEDGTVSFDVPGETERVRVRVQHRDGEASLTRTFGGPPSDGTETAAPTDSPEPTETAESEA